MGTALQPSERSAAQGDAPQVSAGDAKRETLRLERATVVGDRGTVFGPLTFASTASTVMLLGDQGSGRTSLLLAIAGRMRLTEGSLATLGRTKFSDIRRVSALAGFTGIDALEPAVTVRASIRERLGWALPWYRRTPKITEELAHELLAPVFGADEQPPLDRLVRDLDPADDMLLRIGLARLDDPQLIVVDNFDRVRNPDQRARVAQRLGSLRTLGIRSVVVSSDPGDAKAFPEPVEVLDLSSDFAPAP